MVVAREDETGEKALVAYVAPHEGSEITTIALRSYLREKLPDYMVPWVFVVLEALPLTPNGKIDRKALPAPERGRGGADADFVGPRSLLEEILAGIWCDLLGLERQ
ncbi:MAG: hypothetical protein M1380_08650 [Chloroflexi bacterium]|nr:hypothetical protein [Chloroflexota bacterium]